MARVPLRPLVKEWCDRDRSANNPTPHFSAWQAARPRSRTIASKRSTACRCDRRISACPAVPWGRDKPLHLHLQCLEVVGNTRGSFQDKVIRFRGHSATVGMAACLCCRGLGLESAMGACAMLAAVVGAGVFGGSSPRMLGRKGTSEAAPAAAAVRQAVGGGCQSGWGRLLSVTTAIEAGTCRQGDSGWA